MTTTERMKEILRKLARYFEPADWLDVCPRCNGSGKLKEFYRDPDSSDWFCDRFIHYECPRCLGTGRIIRRKNNHID